MLQVSFSQEVDTLCAGSKSTFHVENHEGSKYSWMVKGGSILRGNASEKIDVQWGIVPGLFLVNVIEINPAGCQGDPVTSYIYLRGTSFETTSPNQACLGDSVTLIARGGLSYLWTTGSTDTAIKIKLLHDTIVQVIVSDTVCGNKQDTLSLNVKSYAQPDVTFTTDATEVFLNQHVKFSYTGDSRDRVVWDIQKASASSRKGHGVNVQFIDTGDAYIKIISTNSFGCIDSSLQTINIKYEVLFFPNAFTPNNDGLNDVFKPSGMGMNAYDFVIFNRWGERIFETDNINKGWDGNFKGEPAQQDNYVYHATAKGESGRIYYYSGNIVLIR